uniref:von Willebrand factor type A domain containing protein n=1 Tax=Hirondellea gigas TaxID=1518452 RepID=A0A6A7FZT5_9CRUS
MGGKAPRQMIASVHQRMRFAKRKATLNSSSQPSQARGRTARRSSRSRSRSRSPVYSDEEDAKVIEYDVTYESSFYAHYFATEEVPKPKTDLFVPSISNASTIDPLNVSEKENWIGVSFASKFDGEGMTKIGRPNLNLVLVLDVSSSMNWGFLGDQLSKHKIEVCKTCILKLLTQLRPDDTFGLVIFNTASTVIQPLTKWSDTKVDELKTKINRLRASGGTVITTGIESANKMIQTVEESNDSANRIWFFTDMEVCTTDGQSFTNLIQKNSREAVFSTISGVGMDLESSIIERISKTAGCNYSNVRSSGGFEDYVENEFNYSVTPIAFSVSINITSKNHSFKSGFGTPELRHVKDGDKSCSLSTVFPSRQNENGETRSGILLFRANSKDGKPMKFRVSWDDVNGVVHEQTMETTFKEATKDEMKDEGEDESVYSVSGIRKAILLVRFTDFTLQYIKCRQMTSSVANLKKFEEVRKAYPKFVNYFKREMIVLKDPGLGTEYSHLIDDATADDIPVDELTKQEKFALEDMKIIKKPPPSSSSSSTSSAPMGQDQEDATTCCVCLTNAKNILLRPCRHVCLCDECAPKVQKCPLCSEVITKRTKVYL